jgi:tRNA threonylcarbamoyladenosine biosynthesis protein TsaB
VIVVGFDTATPATAVAVLAGDRAFEARHDPEPGQRPGHATRLLPLVRQAMERASVSWNQVDRLAVGVGPGTFTGLRIGIATAVGIARARDMPVNGISSLRTLAAGANAASHAAPGRLTVAVIDARRGEAFAAAYQGDVELWPPAALGPDALAERVRAIGVGASEAPVAIGDGSVKFRDHLESAGAVVPADDSPLHLVSAAQLCRLAVGREPDHPDAVLPEYVRPPDARPGPRGAGTIRNP